MLFHAFLLKFAGSEYHVCGSSTCTVATLALREKSMLEMVQQAVQEDTGQDLASYGQEVYASVVVVGLAITFPLVDMGNRGIPERLRKLMLIPDGLKQARQLFQNGLTAFLVDLCRDGISMAVFGTYCLQV